MISIFQIPLDYIATRRHPNTESLDGIPYAPGPLPLDRFSMQRLIGEGLPGEGYTPKLWWVGEGPEKCLSITPRCFTTEILPHTQRAHAVESITRWFVHYDLHKL